MGEPVLLLHGNPTWSFFYRELVRALRPSHRAVAPDHIGCGLSAKPQDYPYTLAQHIRNVELLIEHLDLQGITLVMHDWGGPIGLGYAVRHPERIRRIVLLNTAAFPSDGLPWRIAACRLPGIGAFMVRRLNLFVRGALWSACVHPERMPIQVRQAYLAPYGSYADRVGVYRFVRDIPMDTAHPSYGLLEEISGGLARFRDRPAIVCWGMRDFCFTPRFLDRWRLIWPHAEVHRIEDAGHYVMEDAGDQVCRRVLEFLKRSPGESR
jgi:haloalkane dehalogenase